MKVLRKRGRVWLLAGLSVLCGLWTITGPASAASETVSCSQLQAALDQVQSGDTITLTQLCTKSNSGPAQGHFSLPSPSASLTFTLIGQPGSGAGFDGTGVGQSILVGNDQAVTTTVTISHLNFENGSAGSGEFGGAIFLGGDYAMTLDHDTFTDNQADNGGSGGAVTLFSVATTGPISVTNSTFRGNVADAGGGAVAIEPGVAVVLSHNTFSGNKLQAASGFSATGGAVTVFDSEQGLPVLTQVGNRFSGNSITGATTDANGGAESVLGMTLHSTNDVFTGNSLSAAPSGHDAEGAALSILNNVCNTGSAPAHLAKNLVVAGNTIADGGPAGSAHGAIYLGCNTGGPNNLVLDNSTVSGNTGGGSTAGIWGDPGDQLTLNNTILAGDSDGEELTGFTGTGGSVTVSNTDLCAGSSPFTGTGNICAPPKLGKAAAGNVQETYTSPTIDSGSNSLVPSGLNHDVYGRPRITPKLAGHTSLVDMGAAEFVPVEPPRLSISTPVGGATFHQHQQVHTAFTCRETPRGPGIASCRDSGGRNSGALLDTATPGSHRLKVIAISSDGLKTVKTVTYTVKKN